MRKKTWEPVDFPIYMALNGTRENVLQMMWKLHEHGLKGYIREYQDATLGLICVSSADTRRLTLFVNRYGLHTHEAAPPDASFQPFSLRLLHFSHLPTKQPTGSASHIRSSLPLSWYVAVDTPLGAIASYLSRIDTHSYQAGNTLLTYFLGHRKKANQLREAFGASIRPAYGLPDEQEETITKKRATTNGPDRAGA